MTKEYIERGALMQEITAFFEPVKTAEQALMLNHTLKAINLFPAADVVEVTRCKNCTHAGYIDNTLYCYYWGRNADGDDYCSEGYCVEGGADNG